MVDDELDRINAKIRANIFKQLPITKDRPPRVVMQQAAQRFDQEKARRGLFGEIVYGKAKRR